MIMNDYVTSDFYDSIYLWYCFDYLFKKQQIGTFVGLRVVDEKAHFKKYEFVFNAPEGMCKELIELNHKVDYGIYAMFIKKLKKQMYG